METKSFRRVLVFAAWGLLLLVPTSAPTLAQGQGSIGTPFTLQVTFAGPVAVHKPDGGIAHAEFLGKIILKADGSANGGLGLRELGSENPLPMVYRVVAVQTSDDNVYTFSAQRLSPPLGPVTITLRRLATPQQPIAPPGSVTFFVHCLDPLAGGAFSFVTQGHVLRRPTDLPSVTGLVLDPFAYINAQSQTVVVQTSRGTYTANFSNEALVVPSVGAIGSLELTAPEGSTPAGNQAFGSWQITGGHILNLGPAGKYLLLRARPQDNEFPHADDITILLRPEPGATEPCRIYDIAGTQVGTLHFEAEANITIF